MTKQIPNDLSESRMEDIRRLVLGYLDEWKPRFPEVEKVEVVEQPNALVIRAEGRPGAVVNVSMSGDQIRVKAEITLPRAPGRFPEDPQSIEIEEVNGVSEYSHEGKRIYGRDVAEIILNPILDCYRSIWA